MAHYRDLSETTGRRCKVCNQYTPWACKGCDQDTEVWLCHIPATYSACWKAHHNLPNAAYFKTLPDHVGKKYCLQCINSGDQLTRVNTLCVCPSCLSAPKKKASQWEGRVMCEKCFGEHMDDPHVRAQIQGHFCTVYMTQAHCFCRG